MSPLPRKIYLTDERPYDFGEFQTNYLNYRTRRLIPSTEIFWNGEPWYWTNSLGCKGRDLNGDKPVVGIFGDSVVHGCNHQAFVEHIHIAGTEPLNAGIEGMPIESIVDRFEELRDQVPMVCAAVHSGWHNIMYNDTSPEHWAAQLDRIQGVPVIAHFRLTADINEAVIQKGYADALARIHDYGLWGAVDLDTEQGRQTCQAAIDRFNDFIARYCRERGRILINLDDVLAPRTFNDIGDMFADFLHPRPKAYDAMARKIETAIGPAIAACLRTMAT